MIYDVDNEIYIDGELEIQINNWEGTVTFNGDGSVEYEITDGRSTETGSIEMK